MALESLLESLYKQDPIIRETEKTAESVLLAGLKSSNQTVSENPYASFSDADLLKLAQDVLGEETVVEDVQDDVVSEETVEDATKEASADDAELEKIAWDMLAGQVMAHSCVHEFGAIKIALANGVCRVCKENQLDVDGSSICSACTSSDD
jgi:hypothetical protein